MSRQLLLNTTPVTAYADRLDHLATDLESLQGLLRTAMSNVQRSDVPSIDAVEDDYNAAISALKDVVAEAHAHVGRVRFYLGVKETLEREHLNMMALSRLMSVRVADQKEQEAWEEQEMFTPGFMLDASTRLSDQVELPSWKDAKAIEEFTAELGGKQAAIAFLKSVGVATSIISIGVGVHGFLDKKEPIFQRWMDGSGAAFGTIGGIGGGASWLMGGAETAPAWTSGMVEVGVAGGEVTAIAGVTYVYSSYKETQFENAEARGESAGQIATDQVTGQFSKKNLIIDAVDPAILPMRMAQTQFDLTLFGVHEASKGIASLLYPDHTPTDVRPDPPNELVQQWHNVIKTTYPTATVTPVAGAIRVVIPAAHGKPATIIDIDPTTGEPE